MKQFSILMLSAFLFISCQFQGSSEGPSKPGAQKLQKQTPKELVDAYYAQKSLETVFARHPEEECDEEDNGISCARYACNNLLSRFDCDDESEIVEIGRACRGNYASTCLALFDRNLSNFDLDERAEVVEAATSCRYVKQGCLETFERHLSRFDFDDRSELVESANACRGVEGDCVDFVCSRLSRFECDDRSELIAIAQSCGE